MTTDAAQQIQRLADRAELSDLVVRYFLAADGDDADTLATSFAQEASFLVSGQICGDSRDAIVAFLIAERAKMGLTNHVLDSTLFTLQGENRATGIVSAHLELVYEGTALFGAVRYFDEYRRAENGWAIAKRDMRTLYLAPWRDAGDALNSDTPVRWPGQPAQPTDFPRRRG